MGWRNGESGGVERDEERESWPGGVRGEAVNDVGVAGGVGTVGLGWFEVGGELDIETPALMAGLLGTPVSDGSMASRAVVLF